MEAHIRNLSFDDAASLLRFELENRDWFERLVAPRDPDFYSHQGVTAHIRECLDGYAQARWHACVLIGPTGDIVGRANLKDIDVAAGTAEAGYRIGERHTAQGCATLAVRHLMDVARTQWQLQRLRAYVTVNNPASARVLLKCGFRRGEALARLVCLRGQWVDGQAFACDLRSPQKAA